MFLGGKSLMTCILNSTLREGYNIVYRAYGRVLGKEPGPPEVVPLSEDAPLREKLFPYRGKTLKGADDPTQWMDDYDKILVEQVIMHIPQVPGTILRLPMVYGPGDLQHRLFPYLKRIDDRRPHIVLDEGTASWRWTRGYVENVAAAIVAAVLSEQAAGRIYNVGEPETLPISGWVRLIGQAVGWRGEVVSLPKQFVPAHLRLPLNTNQDLIMDSTRIRQELGYTEPVPLAEALQRTIMWERAHPPGHIDPRSFDYATEDAVLSEWNKQHPSEPQSPFWLVEPGGQTGADYAGLEWIISGGQTGADRTALEWAIEHGIPQGGWCPRGRLAEDGPINSRYRLLETPSDDYAQRTEWNVRDSDGTVIFSLAPSLTGGSDLTRYFAERYRKPYLHLHKASARPAVLLVDFLRKHDIHVLNIAGPRAETEPEIGLFVAQVLDEAFV